MDELTEKIKEIIDIEIEKYLSQQKRNVNIPFRRIYNELILLELLTMVKKFPNLRFFQLLSNLGYEVTYNGKDCFYEENYETLKKIRENKERFL